jgi:hypothetical protein
MKVLSVTLLKRRYSVNIDPEYAYRKPPAIQKSSAHFTVSNEGWIPENIDQSRRKEFQEGFPYLFSEIVSTGRYDKST